MASSFVKRYLIALDQHKLIALASFAGVVGLSTVVAMQPPPRIVYHAFGVLAYNSPPTSFSNFGNEILQQGRQLNQDVLLSDYVIKAAADRLKSDPKKLKENVQKNLQFIQPNSNPKDKNAKSDPIIQVEYSDEDPTRAENILAALMPAMVDQSRSINTTRLKGIIDNLNKRLPPANQEFQQAQQQLERYIRTEGPAIAAAQDGSLLASINGSEQQQRQMKLQIEGIDAQMRSLQSKLGLNPDQAYTSSALSADPILANLRAQIYQNEAQMKILSRDYRPDHPTMVELKKRLDAYEEMQRQRAAEVLGGNNMAAPLPSSQIRQDSNLDPARQQLAYSLINLQTQREALQQQLSAVSRSAQELRRDYSVLPNKQIEQARLQQQVQIKQALHDKMQAALADAQAAEAETVSSLTIAKAPQVAVDIKPPLSVRLTVGAGALVGLLVAGGLILLLSTLDGKLYTVEDVRKAVRQREVPLLGELPFVINWEPEQGETPILVNPDSPYLDFYERLRSNMRMGTDQPLKVVLLTSTEVGEGKTVTAYNLAIASARAGKRTLLVEADLRSASYAKTLRLAPDPEANLDPLPYYGARNECIRLVPDIENLYIVPSAGPQRQPASILESSEMRRLLEDARGRFDLVVVDTPALSVCNDALLLEPYADGIVLVTRPRYTHDNMLAEAVEQFSEADMPLLGVVINAVEKPIPMPIAPESVATQVEEEEAATVTR